MDIDHINLALSITQVFGPERAIPRKERLNKANPSISEGEMSKLFEICDDIESFAYDLAERVRDNEMDIKEFEKIVMFKYMKQLVSKFMFEIFFVPFDSLIGELNLEFCFALP